MEPLYTEKMVKNFTDFKDFKYYLLFAVWFDDETQLSARLYGALPEKGGHDVTS